MLGDDVSFNVGDLIVVTWRATGARSYGIYVGKHVPSSDGHDCQCHLLLSLPDEENQFPTDVYHFLMPDSVELVNSIED